MLAVMILILIVLILMLPLLLLAVGNLARTADALEHIARSWSAPEVPDEERRG